MLGSINFSSWNESNESFFLPLSQKLVPKLHPLGIPSYSMLYPPTLTFRHTFLYLLFCKAMKEVTSKMMVERKSDLGKREREMILSRERKGNDTE